ncbi:retrovirus-related pol polyprotein from transposon TNT 1-94 [Tanacetum coccineum]|uniref:Retrovirus-related pol polyprotein from transposon TNT 1-94 n=1 Tax=Tanacetum coccineum TaxID=301880 RepID=A0ABQ5DTI5_9ASTR
MEAVVDQCSVNKNVFEIQIKQLRIDNDQLFSQIMSQEIVHVVANSVDICDVKKLKNNRDAHEVYIKKTIEYADTLHGFVERARTQYPIFSTDDLGLDWIYAHNFLTCLQRLSSYTSGHCEVSESTACLEKASFSCTSGHVEGGNDINIDSLRKHSSPEVHTLSPFLKVETIAPKSIKTGNALFSLQETEDLQGDALLHYDAEMELMNLILLSIPNDIYNSVDACTSAKDIAKKLEKSHDPLALIAHTGLSSRNTSSYYVTHPMSVVDYEDEYQQDDVHTNSEDPLTSVMLLLARAVTQKFSTPTNNRLHTSSNTRNKAIIQGDRVNIQSMNSGNAGRNNRRSYVREEIIEGSNAPNETRNVQRTLRTSSSGNTSTVQCYNCSGKGHYARNCTKPRVRDSKYFMEQMLLAKKEEAGVILTDEQNDFLFADASRMEEIEEISANICLMARIQPTDNNSDDGPSYDSAFISEVQSSSNTENEEQMYPTYTKIINNTIGDDQIDSDIIFDSPNRNVTQKVLTSQLELYKERVWVLENVNGDNNYLNEFLKADKRAKHFSQQAQS